MPKVKTVTPGALSGLTTGVEAVTQDVKAAKDTEYIKALSDYEKELARLEGIKTSELSALEEKQKKIAGLEELAGESFDASVKEQLRNLAGDYSKTVAKIKLGDIDPGEGYKELAEYDKLLTTLETSTPNMNALFQKINDAKDKNSWEVDALVVDGSGKTAEMVELVSDLYDPQNNSNVSFDVRDNKGFFKHKNGQEISVEGLNAIMSGNNPDYPLEFVGNPDEQIQGVFDAFWKANQDGKSFIIDKTTIEKLNRSGRDKTLSTQQKNYDRDAMVKDLKERGAYDNLLDDSEYMTNIWPNLSRGNKRWDPTDPNQRAEAEEFFIQRGIDNFAPKAEGEMISKQSWYTPTKTSSASSPSAPPAPGSAPEFDYIKEKIRVLDLHVRNNNPQGIVEEINNVVQLGNFKGVEAVYQDPTSIAKRLQDQGLNLPDDQLNDEQKKKKKEIKEGGVGSGKIIITGNKLVEDDDGNLVRSAKGSEILVIDPNNYDDLAKLEDLVVEGYYDGVDRKTEGKILVDKSRTGHQADNARNIQFENKREEIKEKVGILTNATQDAKKYFSGRDPNGAYENVTNYTLSQRGKRIKPTGSLSPSQKEIVDYVDVIMEEPTTSEWREKMRKIKLGKFEALDGNTPSFENILSYIVLPWLEEKETIMRGGDNVTTTKREEVLNNLIIQ